VTLGRERQKILAGGGEVTHGEMAFKLELKAKLDLTFVRPRTKVQLETPNSSLSLFSLLFYAGP
jgi:hypothetical protein